MLPDLIIWLILILAGIEDLKRREISLWIVIIGIIAGFLNVFNTTLFSLLAGIILALLIQKFSQKGDIVIVLISSFATPVYNIPIVLISVPIATLITAARKERQQPFVTYLAVIHTAVNLVKYLYFFK